jgi:ubiquinone/menaquinone biosynthesis C-methylase UbiE
LLLGLISLGLVSPEYWKRTQELAFWKKAAEDNLLTPFDDHFYTTHFGLSREYYSGKRILDIGCGPRGSLEWADMAIERIGLDPLANEYLKLGANHHKMSYVTGASEAMPFSDRYFDVVTSFNSLDHVSNLEGTIAEIKRVTKPGGLFLLLTELNHEPDLAEPQSFSWDVIEKFLPDFVLLDEKHYEKRCRGMYDSILEGIVYDHLDPTPRLGILSVKFRKLDSRACADRGRIRM